MPGRILIANSVPTDRITMKVILNAAYYDVAMASSAAETLEKARSQSPDVILVSRTIDGDPQGAEKVIEALVSDSETRHIPVAVTGPDIVEDRISVLRAGAETFLRTPVDNQELCGRVRAMARIAAVRAELKRRQSAALDIGLGEAPGVEELPSQPVRIAIVASQLHSAMRRKAMLNGMIDAELVAIRSDMMLSAIHQNETFDGILLCLDGDDHRDQFSLLSELRTRDGVRNCAIVMLHPEADRDSAIVALDLGADDVMINGRDPEEIALRLCTCVSHKAEARRLNDAFEKGIKLASVDPLTGLYNRRYAFTYLTRAMDEAAATGSSFALMLLDLDKFKAVNDLYGHIAGDQVLLEVARRLNRNVRPSDMISRIGGEEFLIAMPSTSRAVAQRVAERIRKSICASPCYVTEHDQDVNISISIGLAMSSLNGDSTTLEELLTEADRALYVSKNEGRNLVTLAKRTSAA